MLSGSSVTTTVEAPPSHKVYTSRPVQTCQQSEDSEEGPVRIVYSQEQKIAHVIFLVDGTNTSAHSTVCRFFRAIEPTEHTALEYNTGYGYRHPRHLSVTNALPTAYHQAFAPDIIDFARTAYEQLAKLICSKMQTERQREIRVIIYGFSRGAVTACLLAAILSEVGILQTRDPHLMTRTIEWAAGVPGSQNPAPSGLKIRPYTILLDPVRAAKSLQNFRSRATHMSSALVIVAAHETNGAFRPFVIDADEAGIVHRVVCPGTHGDIGGTDITTLDRRKTPAPANIAARVVVRFLYDLHLTPKWRPYAGHILGFNPNRIADTKEMRKLDIVDIIGQRKMVALTLMVIGAVSRISKVLQNPLAPQRAWRACKRTAAPGDLIHEIFDLAESDANGRVGEFDNLADAKVAYVDSEKVGSFVYVFPQPRSV